MIDIFRKAIGAFTTDAWLSGLDCLVENLQQYFENQGAKEGGE